MLAELGADGFFVQAVHSVGAPLQPGQDDVPWPCNTTKYISHFPETREIWSYGSGYGGNALLGKKCYALRIASAMARDEGWLAEHMLILKVTPPEGEAQVHRGGVPVGVRQDQPGHAAAHHPGLADRDHRRRHRLDAVRRGRPAARDQPGGRLLRCRPRHQRSHQPERAATMLASNTVFTNVALTDDGDVWWEGLTDEPPAHLTDWRGQRLDAGRPAARPRTPTPGSPWTPPSARRSPRNGTTRPGVPISAILFGGRRATAVPLVTEAFSWQHGVFLGATIASEKTAAAEGTVGELRHDPFAMLPFCGYNMGDYFGHWLKIGGMTDPDKLPRIYAVNWFRKNADGKFAWPGFGENSRVLKWITERLNGQAEAQATPIGNLPAEEALDTDGLAISDADLELLLSVDTGTWQDEADHTREYFTIVRQPPARAALGRARGAAGAAQVGELTWWPMSQRSRAVPGAVPRASTADLADQYEAELRVCDVQFRSFGGRRVFAGPVRTVSCHEDNGLLRDLVRTPGGGAVLVVDGAARCTPPWSATCSRGRPGSTAGPAWSCTAQSGTAPPWPGSASASRRWAPAHAGAARRVRAPWTSR